MSALSLQFAEPNFKFIVLSALIESEDYLREELEAMKKRLRDVNDMSCEPIAEIRDFLLNAPITQEQAESITDFHPDGGDWAYYYMMNYWDGEDDQFCIESLADISLLPNVEVITIGALVMENSLDLEPLLSLARLKEIDISEYFRKPTPRNEEVIKLLREQGVEIAEEE